MANWREPIFDRTSEDVEFAIQKLKTWKESHTHSTDIRVENDALIVQDAGMAHVTNDKLVSQHDGVAYVENEVLVVHVGDVYELKGCFNLLDLNRIENNIEYMSETLSELGYPQSTFTKKWTRKDMPSGSDIQRILKNISSLIADFHQQGNAPSLPQTMLSYEEINMIEKNLQLLKELLDCMIGSFHKSNTFKSGTTTFLPIRR